MKTIKVKYLLDPAEKDVVQERFLIENLEDMYEARDHKIIGIYHFRGIEKYIADGHKVILNKQGGYCGTNSGTLGDS